jgi:hypothetical protein
MHTYLQPAGEITLGRPPMGRGLAPGRQVPLSGVEQLIRDALPEVSESALAEAMVKRAAEEAALLDERGMMERSRPRPMVADPLEFVMAADPRARIPGGSSVEMSPAAVRGMPARIPGGSSVEMPPAVVRGRPAPGTSWVENIYTPPPPAAAGLQERVAMNPRGNFAVNPATAPGLLLQLLRGR